MTVVANGVDFSGARPSVDTLKKNGKSFVIRYLAPSNPDTAWKLLTKAEVQEYHSGGIHIVSNFEWYGNRALEGHAAGVEDAKVAAAQHLEVGGPANRPIYFSVDTETSGESVSDYFTGVAGVIGHERTGVYGSYDVVKYLLDHKLVAWAWQTYAWSNGQYDQRCQLAQDKDGVTMDGNAVDLDTAHASDYGQW
ncbi:MULTISPECIES: DUF1906 domain-containing protein [Catenuloplanes]|uniref:Rv2525c-like glycoside hydrolase-like domain-containing protein n=1 Tax=Catenuloplanes niger TaxID=587534 RepID=A0AAE3ZK98_9ACTN|nr:DUF1906 domain-containing protein [Catenuloplanes niger]MDR7320776.1 hypothetical protein [Catenuloplanes niger]